MPRGFVLPTVVLLLAAASLLTLLGVLPLADRLTGGGVAALAPALPYVLVSGCLLGVVVSVVVSWLHDRKRDEQRRARQAQRRLAARLGLSFPELQALLRHERPVDERARLLPQARAARTTLRPSAPARDERCRTAHATPPLLSNLHAADRAGGRRALELAAPASPRSGTGASSCGSAAA